MEHIEILTAQNVRIEYTLATLRERIFAAIMDFIVLILFLLGLLYGFSLLNLTHLQTIQVFLMVLAWGGGYVLYQVVCDLFLNGRTFGKMMQHLQTVRIDGQSITLTNSVLRATLSLADTYYCGGAIAMMLVASTDRAQRLGDMAAGTTVINLQSARQYRLDDLLQMDSSDNYTPIYPQIRQLSEDDMLTIQQVLRRSAYFKNQAQETALRETVTHVCQLLAIPMVTPAQYAPFLRTLIKDYIVLTR